MTASDVAAEIRASFQLENSPSSVVMHNCDECVRLALDLGEKRWDQLQVDVLNYHGDSLPLLSPEAFRYFLPAYLLEALRSPEGIMPMHVMFALQPGRLRRREESQFSPNEERAIRSFLQFMKAERADEFRAETERALEYWSAAA